MKPFRFLPTLLLCASSLSAQFSSTTMQELGKLSVTTATRTEQRLQDVPATMYVVTQEDIAQRGYANIIELLEDIPEIEVQERADPNHHNSIVTRGLVGNEKLIYLVDGLRVSSLAGSRHVINRNLPIRFVKRVEVILGPASALYGADAFAGVVNIITIDDKEEASSGTQLMGSYGMHHTTENALWTAGKLGALRYQLNGSFYRGQNDFFPEIYPDDYAWYFSPYLDSNLVQSFSGRDTFPAEPFQQDDLAYVFNGNIDFKNWRFSFMRSSQRMSSSLGGLPSTYPAVEAAVFQTNLSNFALRHVYEKEKWALNSDLQANIYQIAPISRFINIFSNYQPAYKYARNTNIRLRETFHYNRGGKHQFIGGGSFRYTDALPRTSDLPQPFVPGGGDAEQQGLYYLGTEVLGPNGEDLRILQELYPIQESNLGGFAQYQGQFLDKRLQLTLGGRVDYNSRYGLALNPRLGLVWEALEAFSVKGFYGESFLAPSPEDAFSHFGSFNLNANGDGFESGFWHLVNPDVGPEKLRSSELAFIFYKGDWRLSTNAYYYNVSGIVSEGTTFDESFKDAPVAVVNRSVNVGTQEAIGGSFTADYRHRFGKEEQNAFQARLYYSYLDGRLDDLAPLQYAAQHSLRFGSTLILNRFSLNLRGIYRGEAYKRLGNGDVLANEPFLLLNGMLRYAAFQKERLEGTFFLKGNNLLNSRYYHLGNVGGGFDRVPQRPLVLLLGVVLDFK